MQNYNSRFKSDLKKRCFNFSINIISFCDILPNKRSAWVVADQLIRAATSIGANLVEARASSSRLEFKKFYEIALKSSNETIYWLEILLHTQLVSEEKVSPLIQECKEISNMLGAGVIKLKRKTL